VWLHQHRNQKLGVNVINQLIKIKSQNLGPKKRLVKVARILHNEHALGGGGLVGWLGHNVRKKEEED